MHHVYCRDCDFADFIAQATHVESWNPKIVRREFGERVFTGGGCSHKAGWLTTSLRPALCYIAASKTGEAPFPKYLDHIVRPALGLEFPSWYVERLRRLDHE